MKKKLSKTWYAETYQDTSMNVSIVGEVYDRHPQKKIIPLEISFGANCKNWAAKNVERSGKKGNNPIGKYFTNSASVEQ